MRLQAKFKKIMLQRSELTTIAKFKSLMLVPLLLVVLTYISCSVDKPEILEEDPSLSQEIENSRHRIEMREKIQKTMNEEVPIYPGCEGLSSNEARKECMAQKIRERLAQKFDENKEELRELIKERNSQKKR